MKAKAVAAVPDGENEHFDLLLIEDNASDHRFLAAMLRRVPHMSFQLTGASSLKDGIEQLATAAFDLVLLDLGLPDSWGLDTFARVHAAAPHLPVIVLTSSDDIALSARAVQAGAQDFLVKGHVDANLLGRAIRYARARHRAEEALRQSEEKYRDLVENLNEVVCVVTTDGVITYISQVIEQTAGYQPSEMVGRRFADFIYPPDLEALMGSFMVAIAGKPGPREFRAVTKSGAIRWLHSSSRLIQSGENLLGLQAVIMDISDRKWAEDEVRSLNAELERRVAERTAELTASNRELEAFCYSVSHDLRQPLRGLDGYCHLLLADCAERLDEQGRNYLRQVRVAAQRMGELIDDLLGLSQVTRRAMRRERVNLSELAQAIATELQQGEPQRAVTFVIAEDVVANGDARLLRVVLENLLGNAWKYTSKHPTARIEFGASTHAILRTPHPVYFVRDDGAGFEMAYVHKLFRPFERLHGVAEFEGTGIGLATVERIIQRHGGRVWAEGAPEKGATFFFTLETRASEPASAAPAAPTQN
ncbi:MAG: PAS domain S-box protein [Deltaproteobacteria bacterium]|nr:PAS domain S-box protein [Deltaproteobacteria bacterium]